MKQFGRGTHYCTIWLNITPKSRKTCKIRVPKRSVILLRDKLLHDLVEHYAEITPKLHTKNATPPTPKTGRGAKRRGQFCAPPVSRFSAQFWRNPPRPLGLRACRGPKQTQVLTVHSILHTEYRIYYTKETLPYPSHPSCPGVAGELEPRKC